MFMKAFKNSVFKLLVLITLTAFIPVTLMGNDCPSPNGGLHVYPMYNGSEFLPQTNEIRYWFGYINLEDSNIGISPGGANTFSPAPSFRNQPGLFLQGEHPNAFSNTVSSAAGAPIWTLLACSKAASKPEGIPFAGGNGSELNPYQISTLENLQAVQYGPNQHYLLVNDIDATDTSGWNDGDGFIPVGSIDEPFNGTFDGNGHTITGLAINRDNENNVGLFGVTGEGSEINNLGLESVQVSGDIRTGGIAGYHKGSIQSSYVTGNITANTMVGGIAGVNEGTIQNSYSLGELTGEFTGGLAGVNHADGTIQSSYAAGPVSENENTGGVSGVNHGTVSQAFWDTESTGQETGGGGTAKTTHEMNTLIVFINAGWDFKGETENGTGEIWNMGNSRNSGYPYLAWQYPEDPGPDFSGAPHGTGTEEDPYQVSDLSNLEWISDNDTEWNKYFVQTSDIDASATAGWYSGEGFSPIGNDITEFTGNFDGNGYSISGLYINRPATDYVGFFGYTGDGAEIELLAIERAEITGQSYTGGVAGMNSGSITSSYATGTIMVTGDYAGGITGMNQDGGLITTSYSTSSVNGNNHVGGIAGYNSNNASVTNSFAAGKVPAAFGAFIGSNQGTVTGSYWNTTIAGDSPGVVTGSAAGLTGLSTPDMAQENSFNGWDFSSSGEWKMNEEYSFPYLENTGNHTTVVSVINGEEGFRMIGQEGSATYKKLFAPVWIQGFADSDWNGEAEPNVFLYDEANQQWKVPDSANNFFGTSSNQPSGSLKGVLLYLFEDDTYDGQGTEWPKYLATDNHGRNSTYTVPLSYTDTGSSNDDGWNLISNPYPASLNWQDVADNNEFINALPYVYIWDHALNAGEGGYHIHLGFPEPPSLPGASPFNGIIPPMQSFWVKAEEPGASVTFRPEYQETGRDLFKTAPADTETENIPWLSIRIEHEQFSDRLYLFESHEPKKNIRIPKPTTLANRFTELAVIGENGERWLAQSIQEPDEDTTELFFTLELETTENGTFTLFWDKADQLIEKWEFTITDPETGLDFNLKNDRPHILKVAVDENDSVATKTFLLHAIDASENPSDGLNDELPSEIQLEQNYPNPFNPLTVINYQLPENSRVLLEVFDMAGRRVTTLVNGHVDAGTHEVTFDAGNLASGVYVYRLTAGLQMHTKKLTVIK